MSDPVEILQAELDEQTARLSSLMRADEPYASILTLIREMDVLWSFSSQYEEQASNGTIPLLEALKGGWQSLLLAAYSELTMKPGPMFFAYHPQHSELMIPLIRGAGQVACVQRIVDMARHRLIVMKQDDAATFSFELLNEAFSIEFFDKMDLEFVRELLIDKIDAEKYEQLAQEWPDIQKAVDTTVRSPEGMYLSYDSTAEIDEFFEMRAHLHVRRLQMHEDFGDDDVFGGIPYKKYVDFLETVMAVAYRHRAYSAACGLQNPGAYTATLLTYFAQDSPFDDSFLQRFDLSQEQMQQVLSCITLSPDNYQKYLSIAYAAPPPYVRMSSNQTIRSINGCLNNPFQFLNFELKRRFEDDYFKVVNQREDRFRSDLFKLFAEEKIVKVPRQINTKVNGQRTDIDCVVYDSQTKTLGLFQLKWQEPFAHSLKKRRNNAGEFYKANKWVDRVCDWMNRLDDKALLNSLQISGLCPEAQEIDNVYVFVIGRYAGHFTAGEPDERAVWGSWWQMLANVGRMEAEYDDPIRLAAESLEFMAPQRRIERNEMPKVQLEPLAIGPYIIRQEQ